MNSLEYINNDIKTCERLIKKLEKSIDTYDKALQGPLDPIDQRFYRPKQDFIDQLNRYKNTLNILQQIKSELEAWYETKKYLVLNEKTLAFYDSTFEYITLKNDCIDESNSEEEGISIISIKKALEVKE